MIPWKRDRLPTPVFLGFPGGLEDKESACNAGDLGSIPGLKIAWKRDRLPTPVFLGFSGGSAGKESTCKAGYMGSIPGLGRSPGEGNGYPLQYFYPENFMDREAWQAIQSMGSQRVTQD